MYFIHAVLPTIFSEIQQWLPNKPRGLFLVLTLLDFWTTCFVASFFLPILIFSLSTLVFSKVCFVLFFKLVVQEDESQKNIYGQLILAKHCSLGRFIILISILKSLWRLTVNLPNCGESKVSKLFGLQNPLHPNRYITSSCLRQTCLFDLNIFDSRHLVTKGILKPPLRQ